MSTVPACTSDMLKATQALQDILLQYPQIYLEPEEILHAGCYVRTIRVPKGTLLTGALIKIPTVLIVSGAMRMTVGNRIKVVEGYKVFEGAKGRKTIFEALEDSVITMCFATNAPDFKSALSEVVDEPLQEKDKCLASQQQLPPQLQQ